jgi:formate dehydrogenase subunit gamma
MTYQEWNDEIAESLIQKYSMLPGGLIECMHAIQHVFGCVPPESMNLLAEGFNLSRAEVHGVFSFYHEFRSQRAGHKVIQVCQAEACQAMGSRGLTEHVQDLLGLKMGETSANGNFTLEPVYCLGNCALPPNVTVDGKLYARVTEDKFSKILGGGA